MSSIVTFYSFKGGVGRTMALANIAYLLAAEMGKRVLAVDWDLEAPGLYSYFRATPGIAFREADQGRGLIDLLIDAEAPSKPDWHAYITHVDLGEHELSLLTSGRQDHQYPGKVLGFNWHSFFEKSEGGAFIETLRNDWGKEFDVTLIDSRTGITDSGGVCTIQLPDILVPVFTTTEESLHGAIDVVERAQKARQKLAYDRSRLLIFPLPSRYDGRTQYKEARAWLKKFADTLGPYYQDWLPTQVNPLQMIERTKLPYIGYFSFGAKMPVVIEGTSDPEGLGYAYKAAATLIANDFEGADRLLPTSNGEKADQPSREELALFRMKRALGEEKFEWRTIGVLAAKAAILEPEALQVLRDDPDVEFGRSNNGLTIARLRNPERTAR